MLMEKMGQIVSIRSSKDKSYQSESFGIMTAIITHGATAINEINQRRKKKILNDPIVVGLHDSQLKIFPYDNDWDTGICIQPLEKNQNNETISRIREYVCKILNSF